MAFDPSKKLQLGGVAERHPNSVDPDENAIVIPEEIVVSRRGNEQLHVIPTAGDDGIQLRFKTYVNGGDWDGKKWFGYLGKRDRPPVLTPEGARLLASQLNAMCDQIEQL